MNKVLRLTPAGKDYLWGGNRLNTEFSKSIPLSPLAETWECSTHPDGKSMIASGENAGKTLREVLRKHPEWLGTHAQNQEGELPVLIKLIDAKRDLSVQVHPDDDYAREHENGQNGKCEMWYVLDAEKDARLVYGLREDCTAAELRTSLNNETVEELLQYVAVKPGDVFYLEPGTIHALGAGCLVAEIQESSNLTYRLYDYGRRDKQGKLRPLHVDKALDVANLKRSLSPRQPIRLLNYRPGCAHELLCRCRYFQVERLLLNTERLRELVTMNADELSFRVLLCIRGCGSVSSAGESENFFKGDCLFVPAGTSFALHGKAEFLLIGC